MQSTFSRGAAVVGFFVVLVSSIVMAPAAVAATGTNIAVTTSASQVDYQGKVTVTADLSGAQTGGEPVTIYMTPYAGARQIVKSGKVSRTGELSAIVSLTRKTTFQAVYEGDGEHTPSTSGTRSVNVRARVTGRLLEFSDTQGKYKVYRYGEEPPVRVSVAPNHSGVPVTFILQVSVNGKWRTLDKVSGPLGFDSTLTPFIAGGGSPHNYRARATFGGDVDHLGGKTPWMYLRYR